MNAQIALSIVINMAVVRADPSPAVTPAHLVREHWDKVFPGRPVPTMLVDGDERKDWWAAGRELEELAYCHLVQKIDGKWPSEPPSITTQKPG